MNVQPLYSHPYYAMDGKLYIEKQSKSGPYLEQLCNFTPRIVSEVTFDDGQTVRKEYRIGGEDENGNPLPEVDVAADELSKMESYINRDIWAIGEIGMDCYWSKEFLKEQQEVMRIQLEMAAKADLPVIIHSRESTELIINILKDCKHLAPRGVFHAFSGSIETYRELHKLGDWYVGIGGVLTYKKASIAETVRDIPLERILLETDSPYLTPVPFRGKRNESSYVPHIASRLAEITEKDICEIAETTTANARKLFRI